MSSTTPTNRNQEVQTTSDVYTDASQCQEDQNSTSAIQNTVFYKCGFCEKLFESKETYTQHIRDEHMLHIFCCKQKEVNFFNFRSNDIHDVRSVETQTVGSHSCTHAVPSTSGLQQRSLLKSKNPNIAEANGSNVEKPSCLSNVADSTNNEVSANPSVDTEETSQDDQFSIISYENVQSYQSNISSIIENPDNNGSIDKNEDTDKTKEPKSQKIRPEHLQELVQIHSFVGAYQVVGPSGSKNACSVNESDNLECFEEHELGDDEGDELDIVPSCFYKIPDHAYYSKTVFNMPDELLATYFKKKRKRRSKRKNETVEPVETEEPLEMNPEMNSEPEPVLEKRNIRRSRRMSRKSIKILEAIADEEPSPPEQTFTCDYCDSIFSSYNLLVDHVKKNHSYQKEAITCAKCNEKFSTVSKMQHHIKSRSHYIGWYCYPCHKRFYKLEDFWDHGCRHKNRKSFIYIDMKKFYHKDREIWQCDICKELFFAKKVLQNHISKCCLLCDNCDLAFYEAMAYINHKSNCKVPLQDDNSEDVPVKDNSQNECLVHCKYCTQSFSPSEIDNFVSHVEKCPLKEKFKRAEKGQKPKKKRGRKKLEMISQRKITDSEESETEMDIPDRALISQFEMNLDCAEFVEEEFRADSSNAEPTADFFQSLNLQPSARRKYKKRTSPKALRSINVRDKLVLSPELQPSCSIQKLNLTDSGGSSKSQRSLKSTEPELMIVDVRTCDEFFGDENDTPQTTSGEGVSDELNKSASGSARRKLWPDAPTGQAFDIESDGCFSMAVEESDFINLNGEFNLPSEPTIQQNNMHLNEVSPIASSTGNATASESRVGPVIASVKSTGDSVPAPQFLKLPARPKKFNLNGTLKFSSSSEKMVLKTRKGKIIFCYYRQAANCLCCSKCGHWVREKRINKHPCRWIRNYLSNCYVKLTDVKKTGSNVESPRRVVSKEMEIIQNVSKAFSPSEPKQSDDQLLSISQEINAGAAYARLVSLRRNARKSYAELPEVIDKIEAELPENFTYTYGPAENVDIVGETPRKTQSVKIAEWKKKWALKKPKTRRRYAVKKKAIHTANLKLTQEKDFGIEEDEEVTSSKESEVASTDNQKDLNDISLTGLQSHLKHTGSLFSNIKNSLKLKMDEEVEKEKSRITIVRFEGCEDSEDKEDEVQDEEKQTIINETSELEISESEEQKEEELEQNEEELERTEEELKQLEPEATEITVKENPQTTLPSVSVTDSGKRSMIQIRRDYTRKRKSSVQPTVVELNKERSKKITLPDKKQLKLDDNRRQEFSEVEGGVTRSLRHKKTVYYFGKPPSKLNPESKPEETPQPKPATQTRPIAKVKPMETRSQFSPEKAETPQKNVNTATDGTRLAKAKKGTPEKPMTTEEVDLSVEDYLCPICASQFSDNESYRKHTSQHCRTHPYSCNMCGKCFSEISTLTLHIQAANKLAVRSCDACAFQFCTKSEVEKHMKLHKVK